MEGHFYKTEDGVSLELPFSKQEHEYLKNAYTTKATEDQTLVDYVRAKLLDKLPSLDDVDVGEMVENKMRLTIAFASSGMFSTADQIADAVNLIIGKSVYKNSN